MINSYMIHVSYVMKVFNISIYNFLDYLFFRLPIHIAYDNRNKMVTSLTHSHQTGSSGSTEFFLCS